MSKKNITESSTAGKGNAFKTFLSVIFFILILISAFVLALCMSISQKDGDVLKVYSNLFGNSLTDFLGGKLCFWIAFFSVILWFALWIAATKRIGSALRGLGISCTIAPMLILIAEFGTMLVVCTFKFNTNLAPYADILPSQFINTSGKNVIFMLSGAIIAAVGIFICKIKKLPKKNKKEITQVQSEAAAAMSPKDVPTDTYKDAFANMPEASYSKQLTNIDIPVSDSGVSELNAEMRNTSNELDSVCHMCGEKNEPNVKFCGKCGAKLL